MAREAGWHHCHQNVFACKHAYLQTCLLTYIYAYQVMNTTIIMKCPSTNTSYTVRDDYVTQRTGSGQEERVNRALRVAVYAGLLCGQAVMLILIAGDRFIVGAFLRPSEPSYELAINGLPWFTTCSLFFALNVVFVGYYQSITLAKRAMIITMLRGIVFSVLGFIVLPRLIGVTGLWTAIPAAELLMLLIIIAMETGTKRSSSPHS